MRKSDLFYELPPDLIAKTPLPDRTASRLLCLDGMSGRLEDRSFAELPGLLAAGDLLVLNDTRVLPARLYGRKSSGGRVEILVERILDPHAALVHLRASKSPKPGADIVLDGGFQARVRSRQNDLFELEFPGGPPLAEILEAVGHVPLPPYIDRADAPEDRERYQTVYGRHPGAVAAPTAGLHFDADLLARIEAMGVAVAQVTLHVGSGTFLPVRVENLDDHPMHSEFCRVPAEAVAAVEATRDRGGRVVAVGTTAVRALETAARSGRLAPYAGETDIFIRPGYRFQCVDALVTNFHLPESTLLALVCAFSGTSAVLAAYRHAVAERYRFFSYGDAMFLTRQPDPTP